MLNLQPFSMVLGVPWFYPKPQPKPVLQIQVVRKSTRNSRALKWTEEQDKKIVAEYPTANTRMLAQELGRTPKQLRARALFLKVHKTDSFKWRNNPKNTMKFGKAAHERG